MSLAKKYNRRGPLRNFRSRPVWEQNTYSDEYHFGFNEEPHRFHNRDYDTQNFWPSHHEHEDLASNDEESFIEDDFISNDYAVDRFSRSVPPRNRHLGNNRLNSGYERRRNNEPNPYYSDNYYYNPNDDRDAYSYWEDDERGYGYDYYESYPNYGDVGESERRFRRSNDFPQSGFDKRENRQGPRRRGERPNIRDKRY
jgi:hypothetical protein